MLDTYRKAIASNVWHFCANCTTWPVAAYIASQSPEQISDEELCTECVARHEVGDCKDYIYDDPGVIGITHCPVIIDQKKCGHDLLPDLAAGFHRCSSGHRILVVPPARSKQSS